MSRSNSSSVWLLFDGVYEVRSLDRCCFSRTVVLPKIGDCTALCACAVHTRKERLARERKGKWRHVGHLRLDWFTGHWFALTRIYDVSTLKALYGRLLIIHHKTPMFFFTKRGIVATIAKLSLIVSLRVSLSCILWKTAEKLSRRNQYSFIPCIDWLFDYVSQKTALADLSWKTPLIYWVGVYWATVFLQKQQSVFFYTDVFEKQSWENMPQQSFNWSNNTLNCIQWIDYWWKNQTQTRTSLKIREKKHNSSQISGARFHETSAVD